MPNGLDNIIAAETMLSDVDGLRGRLVICGHPLEDLAGRVSYEDLLGLLLADAFSDRTALADPAAALAAARTEVFALAAPDLAGVAHLPAVDALRAAMARLPDSTDPSDAMRLIAAPAVLLPALLRLGRGEAPIAPDATLGHAADALRMMRGTVDPAAGAALETYLVTVSDHGLNASTFAARVVASTGAGLTSAVLAAFGALKGPLHGGAPGPVLDMLDAIATPDRAGPWLDAALDRGERLMGFGHRIYRVRDPRADALMHAVRRLDPAAGTGRLALAAAIEHAALDRLARAKPDRPLATNVEFYTAILLEALGFPRDSFTAVFAMGRVVGWIAHAREQALTGRLIRPQSRYVGLRPDLAA